MNNQFLKTVSEVEAPDFNLLYGKIQNRIHQRTRIGFTAAAAALLIAAALLLYPRFTAESSESLLSYSLDQDDFAVYDPLAPLFDE